MGELKTKRSAKSVEKFLLAVDNDQRRNDAFALLEIFTQATKMSPALWGDSIVGFGEYHYESDRSSQKGDWPLTGFSPRKRNMTVYIMPGFDEYRSELTKLGKHKLSVSCIYFNKLTDIDTKILKRIIRSSVATMKKKYAWQH